MWNSKKIRVLIADDSAFMRRILKEMLSSDYQIEVVGTARNGEEAVTKALELRPDVVTMDVNMPGMDGLTALQYILLKAPCSVIMVSSLTQEGAFTTLEALELGAVDFVGKPGGTVSLGIRQLKEEIIAKVKAAARARLRPRRLERVRVLNQRPLSSRFSSGTRQYSLKVVVIGVSTGGPRTLMDILPYLPKDLPAVVLVVQHMPENFTASFAQRLDQSCQMAVKEASDGDELTPGKVLVARGGYHLKIEKNASGRLVARLSRQPANVLYVPSVNVTMQSVLEKVSPRNIIGVLLTGMGDDGADMMVKIRKQGGYTIAEAEETAVVWGMPREAYIRGGAEVIVPSYCIAEQIIKGVKKD
nr:chemotaxis response regulator protein-glutamate methylesterase [Anoxybacter fermentans]